MENSYRAQVVITNYVQGVGWLTVIGGIVTNDGDDPRFSYTLQMWMTRLDELDWRSPVLMFKEMLALNARTADVCNLIFGDYYIGESEADPPALPSLDTLWTEGLKDVGLDPKEDVDAAGS